MTTDDIKLKMMAVPQNVSILICFYERPFFLPLMVRNIVTQTYAKKHPTNVEVLVADDSVEEYRLDEKKFKEGLGEIKLTYLRVGQKLTIGQKRNLLCEKANNEILIFMDDDDYYFPTYVEYSVSELRKKKKKLVGSNSMLFTYVRHGFKKLSINCVSPRQIHEATMCMLKSHWKRCGGFAPRGNGEGSLLIDGNESDVNGKLDISKIMVCICHDRNTCQKDMFIELGNPADFPLDDEAKDLISSCLSHPLYGKRSKICFKYPSRQRPEIFKATFDRYLEYLSWEHEYMFVVSMDADDTTMNNDDIKLFLDSRRKRVQIEYYYGTSKNKIDACNRDMVAPCADIIVLVSDDMIPQVRGFDDVMVRDMKTHFPDYDGMLNYNDGFRNDWPNICTLTVYGMKYYRRFGYIYNAEYESVYADNEQTRVGRMLGRIRDIDNVLIRHEWNKPEYNDDLRVRTENPSSYEKDRKTFEEREKRNFDLKTEAIVRSPGTSPEDTKTTTQSQSPTDRLLTVYVVVHDLNMIPRIFSALPPSMTESDDVLFQMHFSQLIPVPYTTEYLRRLCSTVLTPYVTFHFPGEKFSDDYVEKVVGGIKTNASETLPDVITFPQRCSLDGGKSFFRITSDPKRTDEDDNVPPRGPWKDNYSKKLTNWNVLRTEAFFKSEPLERVTNIQECVYEFNIDTVKSV